MLCTYLMGYVILLFWYRNLSFGRPGACTSTWRSWGSWEHKEGHCGVRLLILKAFRAVWTRKVYFPMLISMFLFWFLLGLNLVFWNSKTSFWQEKYCKNNFHRSWISHDSRVEFSCFRVAFELIFMTFAALETGLKLDDFQGDSGVTPEHSGGL